MDDLIRKQEAIDALKEQADAMSTWTAERYKQQARGIRTAINILEDLPTIEPRRGKWIYSREYGTAKVWTCSERGWNDIGEWNFCPNCGADMREATE